MKSRLFALVLANLFSAIAARAETWVGSSDVTFKGYSTLHDFVGKVDTVPLKVTVTQGKEGNRSVTATSNVEVKKMTTKDYDRDKNMRTMFNAAKFQLIKVSVAPTEERTLKPRPGTPGSMPVTLTIAGISGTANATVTNLVEAPDNISFDLAFPLSLKTFKLNPPKTMAGLIKVKDNVDVTAHVKLVKQDS
jgi:hypothetical protein